MGQCIEAGDIGVWSLLTMVGGDHGRRAETDNEEGLHGIKSF